MKRSILLNSLMEIANELVDSSSSSSGNEMGMLVLERDSLPKVKEFVDVVNAYSESKVKDKVLNKKLIVIIFINYCLKRTFASVVTFIMISCSNMRKVHDTGS